MNYVSLIEFVTKIQTILSAYVSKVVDSVQKTILYLALMSFKSVQHESDGQQLLENYLTDVDEFALQTVENFFTTTLGAFSGYHMKHNYCISRIRIDLQKATNNTKSITIIAEYFSK